MDDSSSDFGIIFSWLAFIAICGGIGFAIGDRKGAGLRGFLVGVLLGPLGWLIIALSRGNRINCPRCRELVDPEASICPKCRSALFRSVQTRYTQPSSTAGATPPPPGRKGVQLLQIARNGEDLGRLHVAKVKEMIEQGSLSYEDHFLDAETNSWMTLDCCHELV